MHSNPGAPEDYGKAALPRDPLVYGLEQSDNGTTPVSGMALSAQPGSTVESGRGGWAIRAGRGSARCAAGRRAVRVPVPG